MVLYLKYKHFLYRSDDAKVNMLGYQANLPNGSCQFCLIPSSIIVVHVCQKNVSAFFLISLNARNNAFDRTKAFTLALIPFCSNAWSILLLCMIPSLYVT